MQVVKVALHLDARFTVERVKMLLSEALLRQLCLSMSPEEMRLYLPGGGELKVFYIHVCVCIDIAVRDAH